MHRKLLAAVVAALIALPVFAGVAMADSLGQCADPTAHHYEAGKQAWTTVTGIEAQIDPSNTGSQDDCTYPNGFLNNGVFNFVTIVKNGCPTDWSSNQCGQIALGPISCDNLNVNGNNPDCERNVWHLSMRIVECDGDDHVLDFGTSEAGATSLWQPHDYKLAYNFTAQAWTAYIDGTAFKTIYVGSGATFPDMGCLKDTDGTHVPVIGAWQSERWDSGDNWGAASGPDTGPATIFLYMDAQRVRGGGWALPEHNYCDFNNRPYPNQHWQTCDGNTNYYSQMRTWTTY